MTTGTNGPDHLVGTGIDDLLEGLDGDDILEGVGGNDTLIGGAGNDTLNGGAGNDIFKYDAQAFGLDTIQDFTTGDTIDLSGLHVESLSQLLPYMSDVGGKATISLMWKATNLPNETITLNGKTVAQLSATDFTFDTSAHRVNAGGTNDRDVMFGAGGDDSLSGDGGSDFLNSGSGNDVVNGGAGNDVEYTGTGNDTILMPSHGFGLDTVMDFTVASDKIDLSGLHVSSLSQLLPYMGNVAGDGTINLMWNSTSTFNEAITLKSVLVGGLTASNFVFDASVSALNIQATSKNDVVFGALGNDTLNGSGGNDFVNGGDGNDKLIGGTGDDGYFGNAGDDTLFIDGQGFGVDTFNDFSHGHEKIDLSSIHVSSLSQIQPFLANNGSGNATLSLKWHASAAANESITLLGISAGSMTASDFVFDTSTSSLNSLGTAKSDMMFGRTGNDTLNGLNGDDYLNGGDGNDTLIGFNGADTYVGGLGADSFVFGTSEVTLSNSDTVSDFSHAQADVLNVHGIDADKGLSGNQDFHFVATLTGAEQVAVIHLTGNNYRLDFSNDADATAEFSINVVSTTAIVAGDFMM